MIDIFLIDDHPPVTKGLEFMFDWSEDRIQIIGSATTIKEALTKLSVSSPHIILLDLFLGDEDPMVNLSLIRAMHKDIPVIIYSAELSTWWKKRMFSEGISGYLCKCADEEKIISTIQQVAMGDIVLPPDLQEILSANSNKDNPGSITAQDIELGRDLAFGLSIKEIAARHLKSPSAIEKTCRELRNKTGAQTQAELIRILISRRLIPSDLRQHRL